MSMLLNAYKACVMLSDSEDVFLHLRISERAGLVIKGSH